MSDEYSDEQKRMFKNMIPDEVAEVETTETEEIVETPEETGEPAPEPEEVETPEVHSLDEASVLSFLNEKTGGKFENLGDIENLMQEPDSPFANEWMKSANQYMKETGKPIETYFELQRLSNLEEITAEQAIKERMSYEDPDLSKAQIDFMYKRQYSKQEIDEEEMSEEEVQKAKEHNMYVDIQLQKEGKKSAGYIDDLLRDFKAPLPTTESEAPYNSEEYESAWNESINDMESFEFQIGKDRKFNFQVTDEARSSMSQAMTPEQWNEHRYVSDGNMDVEKIAQDRFILENLDRIILAAASERKTDGVQEILTELEGGKAKAGEQPNPQRNNVPDEKSTKSLAQHMFRT